MFRRTEQGTSDSEPVRVPRAHAEGTSHEEAGATPETSQAAEIEPHQKATAGVPQPHGNAEIEDKSRLPDELAGEIMHTLDAGMRIEIPGWGYHTIRLLGVSRIIDQYYDTPDRMFQTWSKVHGKALLLRERREGTIIGEVAPWGIHTREDISTLPVEGETHTWLAKVPLEGVPSSGSMRKAREIETPSTDQDRGTGRVQHLGVIQRVLAIELDPATVDIRECIAKVRKTYGVFSQPTSHDPETHVAKIDLDFIVRTYYRPGGISVERYAKYEAEKQGHNTVSQFEACTLALRTLLHIPEEELPGTAMTPFW